MATIRKLSARELNGLAAGFHPDGGNLYLRVRETGSRAWVFRYRLAGKTIEIGLGPLADRSLAQAREIAGKMRTELADGRDPANLIRVQRDQNAKSFKECAEALIASKKAGWRNAKHVKQWSATLEQYVFPSIGDKLPAAVTVANVVAILRQQVPCASSKEAGDEAPTRAKAKMLPLWEGRTETATRLRQRIEAVLDFAAVHDGDHSRNNPARWKGVLDKLLPAARAVTKKTHFASAPYATVPAIVSALRGKKHLSAYALRFAILAAARSGEARGAQWSEVDMDSRTWTIPADRMKAGRQHRVPLCDEAMEVLAEMQKWRLNESPSVFPGARGGLLSDVALNKTLHAVAPGVTVHGMRSSFREWGAETTAFPSAVLELALAHVNANQVEAAYMRSDLFERRVELMAAWGSYCANNGNVIQLVKGAA